MIIEVLVCGPQAHLCPLNGAGGQCLGGCNSLHCADTRRTVRVRCRHDAHGRECPALQFCALEHWIPTNTSRLRWIQGESYGAMACCKEVGVGRGMGMNWADQHGLALVGAICGGDDSDWWILGPVNGFEWRRKQRC